MKVWRMWAFWLPALYAVLLGAIALDMIYRFTGGGESNLGAWVWIFSNIPAGTVRAVLSGKDMPMDFIVGSGGMLTSAIQLPCLLIIGLAIDAIRSKPGAGSHDKGAP